MESMDLLRRRADHVRPSHDYTIFRDGGVASFPKYGRVARWRPSP
jgi:hypothetical protein